MWKINLIWFNQPSQSRTTRTQTLECKRKKTSIILIIDTPQTNIFSANINELSFSKLLTPIHSSDFLLRYPWPHYYYCNNGEWNLHRKFSRKSMVKKLIRFHPSFLSLFLFLSILSLYLLFNSFNSHLW